MDIIGIFWTSLRVLCKLAVLYNLYHINLYDIYMWQFKVRERRGNIPQRSLFRDFYSCFLPGAVPRPVFVSRSATPVRGGSGRVNLQFSVWNAGPGSGAAPSHRGSPLESRASARQSQGSRTG